MLYKKMFAIVIQDRRVEVLLVLFSVPPLKREHNKTLSCQKKSTNDCVICLRAKVGTARARCRFLPLRSPRSRLVLSPSKHVDGKTKAACESAGGLNPRLARKTPQKKVEKSENYGSLDMSSSRLPRWSPGFEK